MVYRIPNYSFSWFHYSICLHFFTFRRFIHNKFTYFLRIRYFCNVKFIFTRFYTQCYFFKRDSASLLCEQAEENMRYARSAVCDMLPNRSSPLYIPNLSIDK